MSFEALLLVALSLLLAACGGYTPNSNPPVANGSSGGSTGATKSCTDLFTQRVQPRLEFCRNCHVPQGVADVADGKLFMLSSNHAQDFANLRASWEALGGSATAVSRILLMPSGTDTRSHTGGVPWPVGSGAYVDMAAQLAGFTDPQACVLGGGAPDAEAPLLGSMHGGHAWFNFCESKADSTALPADPRSLVQPGVNAGKAVYYNAYWKDCHRDAVPVGEGSPPKTCGELRAQAAHGATMVKGNGAIGAGWYFGGDGEAGNLSAADYGTLWQKWGLSARPDNFDELAAQRYGMGLGTERNPYPLPGEDADATGGGSGQLPTGLTQLHTADGKWSGQLGVTCNVCHSGQVGTPADGPGLGALYGNSNSLSEFGQIDNDLGKGVAPGVAAPLPLVVGRTRGTNNALALQLIVYVVAQDIRPLDPNFLGFTVFSPNGGSLDAPAWWNVGHRPVKFQDGFVAMDALRADFGFFLPGPGPGGFDWVRQHVRDGDTWLMSIKSPAYPRPVDSALAQQGAILFHSKNLWEASLHNTAAKPEGGNGSCASCHGAYSPRYVNDPAYLQTPALEGVASYIVPRDTIATDPARVDSDSEAAEQYGRGDFFAYPETANDDANLDCTTQNRAEVRQGRKQGYLAPPLYGVWASAPYFHNGSVPSVWEVLKPSDRKTLWRRVSTPARLDQLGLVMGYDTDLARAYDHARLGWKYDVLACGDAGTTPYRDCNPSQDTGPTFLDLLNLIDSNNPFSWYLGVPPGNDQQLEDRKIYNTRMYGQGNGGHEFAAVLTDQERKAIIEYLKTL